MGLIHPYWKRIKMDYFEQKKLIHLSRSDLFCQTNGESVFHILYFTIVEAMFALDDNSYITKWLMVMHKFCHYCH
jgi:hypothetical protein